MYALRQRTGRKNQRMDRCGNRTMKSKDDRPEPARQTAVRQRRRDRPRKEAAPVVGRPWQSLSPEAIRQTRSRTAACTRSSWRCRTRSCAGRQANWTPPGALFRPLRSGAGALFAPSPRRRLILEANLTAGDPAWGVARARLSSSRSPALSFPEDQNSYYRFRNSSLETGAPQRANCG